jgi:hypothetical protein
MEPLPHLSVHDHSVRSGKSELCQTFASVNAKDLGITNWRLGRWQPERKSRSVGSAPCKPCAHAE